MVTRSRRMAVCQYVERGEGHEQIRNAYKILVSTLIGRGHLGDLNVDGRIIFKLNLEKWDM
jgi:hypothetical protein